MERELRPARRSHYYRYRTRSSRPRRVVGRAPPRTSCERVVRPGAGDRNRRTKRARVAPPPGLLLVVLSGRLELSRIRARIRRNAALSWRAARARHPVAVRLVREAPAIPTRPGEARGRSDSAGDPAHPRGRARQPEAEARLARRSRLSSPSLRRRVGLAGPATRSDPWSGWRSRSRSTPF